MARRIAWYALVVLIVAGLGLVTKAQNKPADRPPSVPEEMWVPLTDSAGIALSPNLDILDRRHDPALIYGSLMVKTHGVWQKAYLEQAPLKGGFMPIR